MPQAVAGWLITATGATGIAAAAIQAGVALAFNAAIAKLTAPKGPKPKDVQNELRQSDAPRLRYVGRNRATGAVMYWDWHQVGSKRVLFKLIALSQGGITDVRRWWLNDTQVTVTGEAVTGELGDDPPDYAGNVNLRWRSGKDGQLDGGQYPSMLASVPAWTTAHRGRRIGTILAEFKAVKAEDAVEVYPGGEPKVLVEFDGDIVQHPTQERVEHTVNVAWQLYDILTHPTYGWLKRSDLDTALWQQAVVDCFEQVPTSGGTRQRYRGGGGYSLAEPMKDVAQRWLDACDGELFLTVEGKLGIRVGVVRQPIYTITEDKIVSWEGGAGRDAVDVITTLVPKYTDPAGDYQETSADAWDDPVALARYGETLPKEIDLPVVQHHGQARAIAARRAARLNPKWRFTINLRFWGLKLIEQESVWLEFPRIGIGREPFKIVSFEFRPDGGDNGVVTVTLEHMRQQGDLTAAQEGTAPTTTPVTKAPAVLPSIDFISTTLVTGKGAPYVRVVHSQHEGHSVIGQYRPTGSTQPWTEMVREGNAGGVLRTQGLFDGEPIDIRLGIRKADWATTVRGAWTVVTGFEVVADRDAPAAPTVTSFIGAVGGDPFRVTFEPDLGANYSLTRLYRGPTEAFVGSTAIASSAATSSEVTIKGGSVPSGGVTYWLQSENRSGVKSAPVKITTIN